MRTLDQGTLAYPGVTYVIPCCGAKLDHPAPARDLYVGSMFRHTLLNAERMAAADVAKGRGPARVLVLSALYGLVELDQVLEPYDMKMGAPGSVSYQTLAVQALHLGIGWRTRDGRRIGDVCTLLPRAYFERLNIALHAISVWPMDAYEATCGILQQKRVNATQGAVALRATTPAEPAESGLTVWIGGDVNAFWWGVPLLVSYGRLRNAAELPAATAPWVCDSRGFQEIAEHGTWTISAEQYAADLARYAREIGHLTWAAPQDWPASAKMLARTGLSEEEHQRRTVASVVELRRMVRDVPIICVVTGATLAGYLRHIQMYREAGIDLLAEQHPIGVGALVGRPVKEAARILRALHAAGLRRLHGFGVKGKVLDLAGDVLDSIDSASWSSGARHRGGKCPHGIVEWERNCPHAAQTWAAQQRERALRVVPPAQDGPVQTELFNLELFLALATTEQPPLAEDTESVLDACAASGLVGPAVVAEYRRQHGN